MNGYIGKRTEWSEAVCGGMEYGVRNEHGEGILAASLHLFVTNIAFQKKKGHFFKYRSSQSKS